MSGWMDDWLDGKVDACQGFWGYMEARKSPSEKADKEVGIHRRKTLKWYEKRDKEAKKEPPCL